MEIITEKAPEILHHVNITKFRFSDVYIISWLVGGSIFCLYDIRVFRRIDERYHRHLHGDNAVTCVLVWLERKEYVGYMNKLARYPPHHI